LIGLGLRPIPLEIDFRRDAALSKQMMVAAYALFKTETFEQVAQVVESDGCIGGPAQNPSKDFCRHSAILSTVISCMRK